MTGQEFSGVLDFERSLQVGDEVIARWTNSHRFFAARSRVEKINAKSIVVTLTEPCGAPGMSYPVGQRIKCPRLDIGSAWSANNRITPIEETQHE